MLDAEGANNVELQLSAWHHYNPDGVVNPTLLCSSTPIAV